MHLFFTTNVNEFRFQIINCIYRNATLLYFFSLLPTYTHSIGTALFQYKIEFIATDLNVAMRFWRSRVILEVSESQKFWRSFPFFTHKIVNFLRFTLQWSNFRLVGDLIIRLEYKYKRFFIPSNSYVRLCVMKWNTNKEEKKVYVHFTF